MKNHKKFTASFLMTCGKLKLAITNSEGMRMRFENDWITNLLIFSS